MSTDKFNAGVGGGGGGGGGGDKFAMDKHLIQGRVD